MPETTRDEIAKLQEEYAKHPEGRLFVHLAEAYRRSGELERARDLLQQGLQQHDDYLSARILLAEVHAEMGEEEQARATWREVLEQDPENERALRALADLAYVSGREQEALTHYRRIQEIGMDDDEVRDMIRELDQPAATPETAAPARAESAATVEESAPRPAEASERPAARPATTAATAAAPQPPRDAQTASYAHTDAIGLTDLLVRLLEYRDSTFNADSSLTRLLALAIGRELELDPIHLDSLALAALLSDLGGLALSEQARSLPVAGDESSARRRAEQREVAISLQLLQGITLPAGVHEAIRHQHERWDGTGYPDGLRDEEIPYGARVLAIARGCAAMLTPHDGRAARTVPAALDELQRHAGSHYDPVVINVLRRVFQRRAEHGIGFGVGGRIVIVHPEELRGLGLATQLHSNGYVTEMASDISRVRERLRTSPTRAVVVGANLPRNDVGRLIRDVRSNQAHAGIPVIVIDANDMDTRVEYLTAGADVCFSSDVTFREFMATLVALLRRTEESMEPAPRPMESLA
jgi:HD-GYP domain-containing protein (c-di-GMP phosphodiesterase class II)/CheY-like chemotaxis protein